MPCGCDKVLAPRRGEELRPAQAGADLLRPIAALTIGRPASGEVLSARAAEVDVATSCDEREPIRPPASLSCGPTTFASLDGN